MNFEESKKNNDSKTFKEKFDEYELLFTPLLLFISILMIYFFIPQFIFIENYITIFIFPSLLGNVLGAFITYILDKYWKRVNQKSIAEFIRLPTLILILFASLSTFFVQSNPMLSFSFLGIGLGALLSLITTTSLVTYYRSFYSRKNK